MGELLYVKLHLLLLQDLHCGIYSDNALFAFVGYEVMIMSLLSY